MLNIECNQQFLLQTSFRPQKASITNDMSSDDITDITGDEHMSNKQMIKLLRDIATSAPLSVDIHNRITQALLDLLQKEKNT